MRCRWCGSRYFPVEMVVVPWIGPVCRCVDHDGCRARIVAKREMFVLLWS